MRTLHGYAAKELLKIFLMTTVALTVLLVMGGGVANLFRGEGAGAKELLKVFIFFTPVAITLTLPIAALFSSAITYGRMASDNEIVACRAAGINIHRLLMSAFVLGLGVTIFTFWAWNTMLPSLWGKVAELSRKDLPAIVTGQFQKAKTLSYGKYNISANRCDVVPPEQVPEDKRQDHVFLHLTGVAFAEVEEQEPVRWGTAETTVIDFDNSQSTPRITADLQNVRSFDAARRQYYELKHQMLGPIEIPLSMKQKAKFATRTQLQGYLQNPEKIPEIDERLWGMKREMMVYFLATDLEEILSQGQPYTLQGDGISYEIMAEEYHIDPYNGRPSLRKNLRIIETRGAEKRIITGEAATLEIRSSINMDRNNPVITVEMTGNVQITRDHPRPEDHEVRKPRENLEPMPIQSQPRLAKQISSFNLLQLLDSSYKLPLYKRQIQDRDRLLERVNRHLSEIRGELHFRSSYSCSAVAVVLLGAILGIIVRGGQVLTAFGISCIPMVIVAVAAITGRNMADRPDYSLLSISLMWGGTALIYVATAFVAMKVLKR